MPQKPCCCTKGSNGGRVRVMHTHTTTYHVRIRKREHELGLTRVLRGILLKALLLIPLALSLVLELQQAITIFEY